MEIELLKELKRNLLNNINSEVFSNRNIVVFGCNEPAERIIDFLGYNNISVFGIIDNNKLKVGRCLKGICIYEPEALLLPFCKDFIILIASKYYYEMIKQLEQLGYDEKSFIIKVVDYNQLSSNLLSTKEFDKRVMYLYEGEKVFDRLVYSCDEETKIFVFPVNLLGDIYIGFSFLNAYLKKRSIHKYIIICSSNNVEKIGLLFEISSPIFLISIDDMNKLLQYCVFSNMGNNRVLILHHRYPYTVKIGELGNYKGINFADHFKFSIYELTQDIVPEIPSRRPNLDRYISEIFAREKLVKGKTVILFPYANTAPELPPKFWEKMAKELLKCGYIVCTNISSSDEKIIDTTIPIRFDVAVAINFIQEAGYAIGLRSGIFDILSSAKAKKVIIYPDRIYGSGSFYSFFSLRLMGLSEDAIEIIYTEEEDGIIENIINYLEYPHYN